MNNREWHGFLLLFLNITQGFDNPSLPLKEFECYFLITKDPRTDTEWICDPFVNTPGESSMSVQEEDQLLEITTGLKSMFET